MKRIIAVLLIMMSFASVEADAVLKEDISFVKEGNIISLNGISDANSHYTVNITGKENDDLYAVEEFSADESGLVNKQIILPDDMPSDEYRLVIGGDASETDPLSNRTYDFEVLRDDIDIEYIRTDVSGNLRKGGIFNASITLFGNTEPGGDISFKITLRHRGVEVVSQNITKASGEAVGEFIISSTMQIPYLAPDSKDYTLDIEMNDGVFADGDKVKTVSTLTVGVPAEKPVQPEAEYKNISIESGNVHISSTAEGADGIYVKFTKDNAVYGIVQGEYSGNADIKIPELPQGEYEVTAGLYGARGESEPILYTVEKGVSKKPYSCGTYINPETQNEHFWYINENGAMIRDGKPYIPVGGMVCINTLTGYNTSNDWLNRQSWISDKKRLQALYDNGVRDIYINSVNSSAPEWVLTEVCSYLDNVGFNYGIQYGCDTFDKELYYIRANEGNRAVYGASDTASVDFSDVNGTLIGGLFTAVRNGAAVYCGECSVNGNTLICKLPEGKYDVYFTPRVRLSVATFNDFWNNRKYFETTREDFAKQLSGENLITVIDPVANETGMYNYLESIRPCGEEYNALFKSWLTEKYQTTEDIERSWGIRGIDFDIASRLVPLYTNKENIRIYCIDEHTGKAYISDGKKGIMWQDYLEFRDSSYAEFYNDVADAVKRGADIPVIIKNVWGHKEYFINRRAVGGFDGLGAESYGDLGDISGKTFSNFGMTKQFAKTAWSIVTETSTDEDTNRKYQSGQYGYGTEEYMKSHFDTHFQSGARGIYDFVLTCPHDGIIQTAYSYEENPLQFEWLKNYRDMTDAEKIANEPFSKPTIAVMNFNSNFYTVPNRWTAVLPKQYSELYSAYISDDFGVWQTDDVMESDILAATFETKPASVIWGPRFSKEIKNEDKKLLYMGFRKDIGEVDGIDGYFTSRFSKNDNGADVQVLKETDTSIVLARSVDGKPYALRDGNLYIIAAKDASVASGLNYIQEIGILYDKLGFYADIPNIMEPDGNGRVDIVSRAYNSYSNVMEGKIIAAAYDETGKLTGANLSEFRLNRGTLDLDINITPAENDKTIKCFVFGENMKPLSEAQVKEVNN